MSNPTLVMFLAVERQKLTLPIRDWTNEIGVLLQEAYDNRPQSRFCMAIGGSGFYDLLNIRDRCNLKGLDFLDSECSTLQEVELIFAIRSLTVIIDELFNNLNSWYYTDIKNTSKENLLASFEKAIASYDINWEDGEDAVFSFIKTLVAVMSDALTNDEVFFVYQLRILKAFLLTITSQRVRVI